MLETAQGMSPMDAVSRGYFIAINNDYLIMAQSYANHPQCTALVSEVQAIPMSEVISISPRRESIKEKAMRLFWKVRGVA